jgi:hypothetical protein
MRSHKPHLVKIVVLGHTIKATGFLIAQYVPLEGIKISRSRPFVFFVNLDSIVQEVRHNVLNALQRLLLLAKANHIVLHVLMVLALMQNTSNAFVKQDFSRITV